MSSLFVVVVVVVVVVVAVVVVVVVVLVVVVVVVDLVLLVVRVYATQYEAMSRPVRHSTRTVFSPGEILDINLLHKLTTHGRTNELTMC